MKLCAICHTENSDTAETCTACGEGSWVSALYHRPITEDGSIVEQIRSDVHPPPAAPAPTAPETPQAKGKRSK